jgi:two-component system NarL family response regulator
MELSPKGPMLKPAGPIRVLIADDHPVVRDGLAAILDCESDITVIGQASDGFEAVELHRALRPDVTLVDMAMPRMDGPQVIAAVRKECPQARFVVLTVYSGEEDIHRAFQAGAQAYLLKDAPEKEILETLRAVHQGARRIPPFIAERLAEHLVEPELTQREMEVLHLLAQGRTGDEMARCLGITPRTVKAHVNAILSKLEAKNRVQAISIALRRGLIHLP